MAEFSGGTPTHGSSNTPPRNNRVPLLTHGVSNESLTRSDRQISGDVPIARYGLLEAPFSPPTTPVLGPGVSLDHAPLMFLQAPSGDSLHTDDAPMVSPKRSGTSWWWRLLSFTGPGWLMSIAYVDPGNLEADLQCGAQYGYGLLWALMWATLGGLGMQLIAARLGCTTRKHLAEHCRDNYVYSTRIMLWALTELAIIGSDIQEVIGCAIGLRLLLGIPLTAGVVMTATAAFGFLFLERLGTRPLELFFGMLILILSLTMGGLFCIIKPDRMAVVEGLAFPRMPPSAVKQVVGMVGCVIMPHNLFLHSALVNSRVVEKGEEREAIMFFTIESSAAIFTSLLINTSVVAVFAKGFYGSADAGAIGLENAGDYLGQAFGAPLRIIWALGLVAAGQSSTMTGAYAGQWVMQGYLQLQVKPWKRVLITRSMALIPTLSVAIYFGGGNTGLDAFNEYLNVLQSLVLPFAVVPLLTFAGARSVMGDLVLSRGAATAAWAATALIMGANVYLFILQFEETMGQLGLGVGIMAYIALITYVALTPKLRAVEGTSTS